MEISISNVASEKAICNFFYGYWFLLGFDLLRLATNGPFAAELFVNFSSAERNGDWCKTADGYQQHTQSKQKQHELVSVGVQFSTVQFWIKTSTHKERLFRGK